MNRMNYVEYRKGEGGSCDVEYTILHNINYSTIYVHIYWIILNLFLGEIRLSNRIPTLTV